LTLTCLLTNLPEDTHAWKNGTGFPLGSAKTLTLTDTNFKESGYVSCDASTTRAYVYVNLQAVPTTTEAYKPPEGKIPFVHIHSLNDVEIKQRANIMFACIVSDPEASVNFFRVDGLMSPGVSVEKNVLTFDSFRREDAGEYACTARNDYGEHTEHMLLTKEMDGSYNYKTVNHEYNSISVSVSGDVREGSYVELNPQLTRSFSSGLRRLRRQLPYQVDYYTWIRYPSLPKSAVTRTNGSFLIQQFSEQEDNGLYFVRATHGDSHLYGSRLVASNSYLLDGENPFFSIEKEDEDSLIVKCRPCKS